MSIQAKLIATLGGIIVFTLVCLGCYAYGEQVGTDLEKGRWQARENQRVSNVARTAIAQTGEVVAGVKQDNEIERKANEALVTAKAELATARADNRRLITANGGLRIDAAACAGRGGSTAEADATGTGRSGDTLAATIALPRQVDEDLQDSADEADNYLEILRAVQQWAVEHGYIGPVKTYTPPAS